jgi:hypothetical protein
MTSWKALCPLANANSCYDSFAIQSISPKRIPARMAASKGPRQPSGVLEPSSVRLPAVLRLDWYTSAAGSGMEHRHLESTFPVARLAMVVGHGQDPGRILPLLDKSPRRENRGV